MEEKMLIDAICRNLEDLRSDVRSDETESPFALFPQVNDLLRMAYTLRVRIALKAKQAA